MLRARQCLAEIADLYQSGPNKKGADLLERVADLFFLTVDQQSADDRSAFGDVMERMAIDADTLTRTRFSERISKTESAPLDLIRGLARDEICVARPVLQYSPCLREGDLVSISSDAEQDHLMATAHRAEITEPVTDIIVERGNLNVLKAVISNTGAKFSAESRHRLLNTPELQEELQQVMRARRDLAPSPFARLKRLTEAEFWQQISEVALMTDEEPDDVKSAIEAPADEVKPDEQAGKELEKNTSKEHRMEPTHPASEKALVNAAKSGKVVETVQSFAKITQLDEVMIEQCIFKAHVPSLIVLCKAHSLAPSTFTTMLQLRENHTGTPINDTVGLLRRYEGMTTDTAQRIIRFSDKRRELTVNKPVPKAP
jgi:uncharacterized protein (DUF2336 family)